MSHPCGRISKTSKKGRAMDTVLLDMDGTLLDTLDDIQASVNYALERAGLPLVSRDETRQAAGYGSVVLMELLSKHAYTKESQEFNQLFDDYSAYYREHSDDNTRPYPGIIEMLSGLKDRGIKMAVVSNKTQPETEALPQLWFAEYIPVAVGRIEGVPPKPDPAMALKAIELLSASAKDALFMGDSQPDVRTGKNAKCASVACTWGFRDFATLEEERPDFIINNPFELLDIIDAL